MNKFDSTRLYTEEELLKHIAIILSEMNNKLSKLIKVNKKT